MPESRHLCVSVHDVAPATWRSCQRVLAAVREVAEIPVTLLVVPAYHGQCSALAPGFESAMTDQLAQGHELALHGYFIATLASRNRQSTGCGAASIPPAKASSGR